jgi:hypothetical protein
MNRSEELIARLEVEIVARDARIAELESSYAGLERIAAVVSADSDAIHTENDRLRAELAALREQVSVAWKVTNRITGDALLCNYRPGGLNYDYSPLYADPVAKPDYDPLTCDYCGVGTPDPWHGSGEMHMGKESKHIHACDNCRDRLPRYAAPQVVMPEREGGHAQKSFWAGFEVARMRPEESNIRAAWNEFKSSEQFARLNAADQEVGE